MSKYNLPAVFALIIYPIFIITLVVNYTLDYQVGGLKGCCFLGGTIYVTLLLVLVCIDYGRMIPTK